MIARCGAFRDDRSGNVALLFALVLSPLMAAAALGSDEIQLRLFRQTLQKVALDGANQAAGMELEASDETRKAAATAALRKQLALAHLSPETVGARIDVARSHADSLRATVMLEATPSLTFGLLRNRATPLRVVATADNKGALATERHIQCHAASTQAQFDALGC
jgi:Flp pilus assembly protein TadG